ncbi:MAG TPA: GNAT family protein [Actinomycetota bacterium]|nr:GNAT family protein [Actinomycetota bacterium]
MLVEGDRILLRGHERADAAALADILTRNRVFFRPFEPERPERLLTVRGQQEDIARWQREWRNDGAYAFVVALREGGTIVGRVALTNVVRFAWLNANLGYFIDQDHNGRGYGTEAVRLATRFAFRDAGLHRLQAAVRVDNARSIRVLEKAGYRREALAERYLFIDGAWRDMYLYAQTAEELLG